MQTHARYMDPSPLSTLSFYVFAPKFRFTFLRRTFRLRLDKKYGGGGIQRKSEGIGGKGESNAAMDEKVA
jgi:hypothetical protein